MNLPTEYTAHTELINPRGIFSVYSVCSVGQPD